MTTQTQTGPDAPTHDTRLAAGPGTWPQPDGAWLGDTTPRRTRVVLGLVAVLALTGVAILRQPSGSVAAEGRGGGIDAGRLPTRHVPDYQLAQPSMEFIDAQGLGGHAGIPRPPAHDSDGRSNLGVLVGPAWCVWVYGGTDGVRYSVADLRGQVLGAGLNADEVHEQFPEINIPAMDFGPDGVRHEPLMLMWVGEKP